MAPRINTGAAPWILSRVPVRHLGSKLVRRLGFCLEFQCGTLDSVSDSGAAPRILSRVPIRHLGFCLVFRIGASDPYWCGASDSVSCSGSASRIDTGAAPRILSCVAVQHLGSILEHNLPRQLCNLEEINDQVDHTRLPNLQTQSAVTYQPSAHPMTGHLGVVGTR